MARSLRKGIVVGEGDPPKRPPRPSHKGALARAKAAEEAAAKQREARVPPDPPPDRDRSG